MSTLKRVYLFRDKLCREIVRTIPENRLCKINVNYQQLNLKIPLLEAHYLYPLVTFVLNY